LNLIEFFSAAETIVFRHFKPWLSADFPVEIQAGSDFAKTPLDLM
jgi:hypothetical protein